MQMRPNEVKEKSKNIESDVDLTRERDKKSESHYNKSNLTESSENSPSYREILNQEFFKRNQNNSRYTLGAYSKQIGLKASLLHDILKGRHGMSRQKAEVIAEKLQFDGYKKALFCALVEKEHGRSQKTRDLAEKNLEKIKQSLKFKELAIDQFKLIAEWYHFAILELTQLDGFEPNIAWIAKKLSVSEKQVQFAVRRLQKLGLLKVESAKWICTEDYSLVAAKTPTKAIQKYHKEILEKAKAAIENQPLELREYNAATFSLTSDQLPEAKKMLRDFLQNFGQKFSTSEKKDSVYCLSTQFFALTAKDAE